MHGESGELRIPCTAACAPVWVNRYTSQQQIISAIQSNSKTASPNKPAINAPQATKHATSLRQRVDVFTTLACTSQPNPKAKQHQQQNGWHGRGAADADPKWEVPASDGHGSRARKHGRSDIAAAGGARFMCGLHATPTRPAAV